MSDTLSADLLMEILSRVPAESLLGLRSVCKDWCRMIDDPYINIHLERQLLKIHDSSNGLGHLLLVNHVQDRQLCSLSLLNFQFDRPLKFETKRMMNPNPLKGPETSISSCNGLILVSSRFYKFWSIWNPLTQELHELPLDRWSEFWFLDVLSGFGYDIGADDYKVLKHIEYVDPERFIKYVTCVYSLKSNSWKRIEDFPFRIMQFGIDRSSGAFYNGALHWIGNRLHEDKQTENLIVVAFDLKAEDSRTYPLPSLQLDRLMSPTLQLDELYGCLSLSLYSDFERFEVWLMNDYGVKNSWTKFLSIEENSFIRCNPRTPRTINYSNRKGLILLQISGKLCLYDPGSNAMEEFSIPGYLKLFSTQVFRPSLVRIKKEIKW